MSDDARTLLAIFIAAGLAWAGWWIAISILAWAVNAALLNFLSRALFVRDDESMWQLVSLIGGIVPGVVTATGLVWLLSRDGKDAMPRS